jgi:hypothetical protein
MAVLTPTQVTIAGVQVQKAAADVAGDSFEPGTNLKFHVFNGSGGAITVTIVVPGTTKYGQADPDVTRSIPAGQEWAFGPFGNDLADPTTGLVNVTYSAVTTVTRVLLRG